VPTDPDLERARDWLDRRRLVGVTPTPLLAARLRARRLGWRTAVIAFVIAFLGPILLTSTDDFAQPGAHADSVDWSVLVNLAVIVGLLAGLWRQRRTERRLLEGLPVRTARATRAPGATRLRAAALIYGGGLLLGAVIAVATTGPDQELGVTFLVGVALLGLLGWLTLSAVLRRPALTGDDGSLVVDDVLRAEDARRALAPYPLLVALVAGVASSTRSWVAWPFLGYVAIGLIVWMMAGRVSGRVEVSR
jgi:hypothetical protein